MRRKCKSRVNFFVLKDAALGCVGLALAAGQQPFNHLSQLGQIVLDGTSEDFQIEKKVFVDYKITHRAHLRPRKFTMLSDEVWSQFLNFGRRFADNFDVANDCVLAALILLKASEISMSRR